MEASTRTTVIMDNQMCVQVQGEEITPEEYYKEAGWTLAGERMSRLRRREPASGVPEGHGESQASAKAKFNKNVRASVIKAARMPAMPLEESEIVVRPRGGTGHRQNQHHHRRPRPYTQLPRSPARKALRTPSAPTHNRILRSSVHRTKTTRKGTLKSRKSLFKASPTEVSAYRTAPHDTVKGVIRGIPADANAEELDRNIVNERNPLAVGAKRIGTAIVVFQGPKMSSVIPMPIQGR
ncbi:hypothetical protein MTO96_018787 [Rhipicephalus appendiculatus]